jgi:hypothetical protein
MSSREETAYLLLRNTERNLAAAIELDDDAETLDVKLSSGVILSGKAVDVEGKGIPNAEISLTFWNSGSGYGSREVTEINTEGYFQIRAVPSGHRYSVTASAEGYGQQYVTINASGTVDDRRELEPMVLTVADLPISGVVVDVEDKPVAGARIYARGPGQPHRNTITDEMGRFLIENMCEGRIIIQANTSSTTRLHGNIDTEGGAMDIRIVVAELDARGRPVTKRPPSLVGKHLPELKFLKVDLSPDNKMLLVCFFDMQQRSSRNGINQLAKQTEQLRQKGVTVIAVQASKVDESQLSEWVKANNIPFPVGMIEDDEEKIRFNWGVKSLPWLILTDSEHIVHAEGFALNELSEKLKQMEGE